MIAGDLKNSNDVLQSNCIAVLHFRLSLHIINFPAADNCFAVTVCRQTFLGKPNDALTAVPRFLATAPSIDCHKLASLWSTFARTTHVWHQVAHEGARD